MLNDQFSVQVHLAPAPVVAGISTWTATIRPGIADWLARKVAVTDHLEAVGAPVVGNSRELPPGPHVRDGLTMTFTEWAPPGSDRTPDAADCVAMLPDLHAALATYPGELPLLAPVHEDVPYGLAALERHPDVLSTEERDRLLAAHERLAPFAAAPGDTTVLHGDLHPGNLHATGGELRWLDLEDVCRGPVGYDLALLRWMDPTAGDGWAEPERARAVLGPAGGVPRSVHARVPRRLRRRPGVGRLHPLVRQPDQLVIPPGAGQAAARTASIVSASAAVLSGR